ncbi:MAG: TlpA family protein disulfide reductase, partial [Flavisolibacter sp.]
NSMYLFPGDKVEANIDYENAQNSSFRGSHYHENEYLKSIPYPKAGSFLEGRQNIKPGIEETFLSIIDIAKQRRKKLSNIKGLSSSFRLLEQHRINADLLNSFYAVSSYFPLVHKLAGDSLAAFNKKFGDLVDSYARKFVPLTVNAYLMKLEVYRDVAGRILRLTDNASEDAAAINDWWLAKEIVHEMRTDSSSFDEQKINQIKTAAFRDEAFKTYEQLKNLNGSNAFDLELTDSKGNTMQLSSLKGKIIFIDVWATWCLPCMEENPHLDALKKKFKSHSEVAFLSLSIDRDTAGWTRFVNKKQLQGLQYITDLATLEPYHVSEIPRTIIIDKNFKIYAMRGPMPSDAETAVIIEKMLQ